MKLFVNPTSPFVRIVRMAIIEKGLTEAIEITAADPWADPPDLLDANSAGRVPALVTDDGIRLTEALLILQHLETVKPEPAILPRGAAGAAILSRAGIAIGVFDAAVSVLISRKSAPDFDAHMVGKKRFRTMRDGLALLDRTSPNGLKSTLDIADIAAITALDYVVLRFTDVDWRGTAPRLAAFAAAHADRLSVAETRPKA